MSEIHFDEAPALGTREAAYLTAAGLIYTAISAGSKPTPDTFRYWLDCYYQARKAYEEEDAEPYLTEKDLRPIRDALDALYSLLEISGQADAGPDSEPCPEPQQAREDLAAQGRWKRALLNRLTVLREGGCTTAQLAETGHIGMDAILSILEGKKVPLSIYTRLEKAMDAWEAAARDEA